MQNNVRLTVTEDPLVEGAECVFAPYYYGGSNATAVARHLIDWGATRGSLLAVGFNDRHHFEVVGSAFLIAPGIALSATHVYADRLSEIRSGRQAAFALGVDGSEARYWQVDGVSHMGRTDISILCLRARSKLPEDGFYHQFPVSTRSPRIGESLEILGFRHPDRQIPLALGKLTGDLFVARGVVTSVFLNGRGTSLPYPVFEIMAGSLGGMSGGVAIDGSGHVLGVISTGFSTEAGDGPTYASMIWPCLIGPVYPRWPVGLYPKHARLMDIDERCVFIAGRGALKRVNRKRWRYTAWRDMDP